MVFLEPAGPLVWSGSVTIKRADFPAEPALNTLYTKFYLYYLGLGSISPLLVHLLVLVTFSRWASLRQLIHSLCQETILRVALRSALQVGFSFLLKKKGIRLFFRDAAASVTSDLSELIQQLRLTGLFEGHSRTLSDTVKTTGYSGSFDFFFFYFGNIGLF